MAVAPVQLPQIGFIAHNPSRGLRGQITARFVPESALGLDAALLALVRRRLDPEATYRLRDANTPIWPGAAFTISLDAIQANARQLNAGRWPVTIIQQGVAPDVVVYDDPDDVDCLVCFDAPKTDVLIPCGHYILCEQCSRKVRSCPICRQKITWTVPRALINV